MYNLKFKKSVAKDLKKIGQEKGEEIFRAIREKLLPNLSCGKLIKGNSVSIWIFRTGDYRLFYTLNDTAFVVLVLRIGYKREAYER